MSSTTVLHNAVESTDSEPHSQVKIHLSTRHPDITLPENPGPILVNTSTVISELLRRLHADKNRQTYVAMHSLLLSTPS